MKDKVEEILYFIESSFIDYELLEFTLNIQWSIYFTGEVNVSHNYFDDKTLEEYVYTKSLEIGGFDREKIQNYREVAVFWLKFQSKNSYRKIPCLRKEMNEKFNEYIIDAVNKFNINSKEFKINDFKYDKLNFYFRKVFDGSVRKSNKYNLYTHSVIKAYSEVKQIRDDFQYVNYDLPF